MSLTIIDNNNIFQKEVIGNVRTAQEDSHDIAALTPNGDVFVVCDGMGGHVGGKQASTIAVNSIIEYLKKERYPEPKQALNGALQFANMQILGYANEHPELKGMGTTACIVLLQDTEAYIAHVGDSRIYLYLGEEKQLQRITKDHSFVQALVDAGQITEEEAEHHPNKNRILKALGIIPELVPSFGSVQPKNGDVFLICSDGLSGMISDSTIRDVLMQDTSIGDKGETLVNLALEAGGLDNITVELIQIANSPHANSDIQNANPTKTKRRANIKWKHIVKVALVVVVVLLSCALLTYEGVIISYKNKIEKCETQCEDIKKRIGDIELQIVYLKGKREKADNDKKRGYNPDKFKGDERVSRYKSQIDALEDEIKSKNDSISNFKAYIDKCNERLDKLKFTRKK